ncbi:MAG: geranylgeranylglyceryl/heptaprenylglyceryl phosphate synthase [Candidatus Methanomethylophilaceae archaeon]|jgi:phosphoglycerol geranylgeranyltransferase|nr:geranylgeranylglyceryl/heptaprenylglyceryl phosphate synthase [Candidatus Methanomethylophilaceae archaeon]MDD4708485.1 geranylgeranylglyceryl/heptaprenylglyceryl phosphate synthase [Candidatus Methanomethylophilaceae archaeon]MDY0251621.1 geranylgeranylglyceryl/heptaprenylglyceryl phosphate synthase [Candidatus Methanomethylophilaceae archaeon]
MMNVEQYLSDRMKEGTIHMALLDPDKQRPEDAGKLAAAAKRAGSDVIMIGGSTGVNSENLGATARAIREMSGLPSIHFPGGPKELSAEVDSIFFMSLVNSTDPLWIFKAQAYAAPFVKKLGIETLSMGYIIVEPGMKVGEVGKADPIKRNEVDKAVGYAIACEMYGMKYVYLEAGSGADRPVPQEMIRAVKDSISIPLIVGGGIRTPEAARAAREAGADAIVTGTFIEECSDIARLKDVVDAARGRP